MVKPTALILAHQGGWDELLLVVAPLLVIAALLVITNKRVSDKLQETQRAEVPQQDPQPNEADIDER